MQKAELDYLSSRNISFQNETNKEQLKAIALEKELARLQAQYTELKDAYLNLVKGHNQMVVDKNKTIIQLTNQIKELKKSRGE